MSRYEAYHTPKLDCKNTYPLKESDTPTEYQPSATHCCKNINQEWNNNGEDKPGRRSCTLARWRTRAHMACARTYEANSFSQNMCYPPSQRNPYPWWAQCSLTLKFKFEAPIFSSLRPKRINFTYIKVISNVRISR